MTRNLSVERTTEKWDESAVHDSGSGIKITKCVVGCKWSGEIEGESILTYSMAYLSDGSAIFSGFEWVQGRLGAKQGSFILSHNGKFLEGQAKIAVEVVANSATGGLQGLQGKGEITSSSKDPMKSTLTLQAESSR